MEMPIARGLAWVSLVFADIFAVMSLWDAWFGKDVKSGLSTFFGAFIVFPLIIVALSLFGKFHCFPQIGIFSVMIAPIILVMLDIIKKH